MLIPVVGPAKPGRPKADPLRKLPIVAGAMLASVALANGAALFALAGGAVAQPLQEPPLAARIALIATAVTLLVLAPAFEALIRSRAIPPASPRSPEATYVAGKVAGLALREAGGLVGMVLGLITGQWLWPALFGGLAVITLLMAWPRADELKTLARGAGELS